MGATEMNKEGNRPVVWIEWKFDALPLYSMQMENGLYTLLPGYESRPNPSPFKKRRTESSCPEGGFVSSGSLSNRMSSEKTLSDCLEQRTKAGAETKVNFSGKLFWIECVATLNEAEPEHAIAASPAGASFWLEV